MILGQLALVIMAQNTLYWMDSVDELKMTPPTFHTEEESI